MVVERGEELPGRLSQHRGGLRVVDALDEDLVRTHLRRLRNDRPGDHRPSRVRARVGETAPGSADRVLRDLRQRGSIDYEVVSRRSSLYRVLATGRVEQVEMWE